MRTDALVLNQRGASDDGVFALGFTVARRLWHRFEWEENISRGVGNPFVDGEGLGWVFAGTGRGALFATNDDRHSVYLGLGTALAIGGGYRTLNFAFAELAYEWRGRGRWCLLAAVGPSVLMNKPNEDVCAKSPAFCDSFKQWRVDPWGHARVGVGWMF